MFARRPFRAVGFLLLFVALACSAITREASAQAFSLTILPNTIPSGTANTSYSQMLTAVGGNAPYTFAVTSGSLPPGITLDTGGLLSGSPTTANSYSFTVTATDVDGNTGFRPYTFSIGTAGALTINPATLPNGTQGTAYSQSVSASGGSGGYVYSISAGSLPSGLSLNPGSGAITGTPSSGGSFNFTVAARDSNGNTGARGYTVNIGTASLAVNPSSLPAGTQGVAYNRTVSASGGTGPYTFSLASGSLPAGLALDGSTGIISGTPSGSGSSSFTVHAQDSAGNVGNRGYTINIGTNSLTLNPASLPNGTQGSPYSQSISGSGGTAPYTYAIQSGSLPSGLSLNPGNGAISGTPSATGVFNFVAAVGDSVGNTGTRSYSITVDLAPLTVNPSSLPAGTQGTPYNQTISASGGTAPYSYSVTSGSLPPGLSLNPSSGVLSGTPTTAGPYTFTVQATDTTPNSGSRNFSLNIGGNVLTVNPSALPNATQNVAYNQTVSASGGTGPYTFSITSGALPAGLTLNPGTGQISGTPTGSGASAFTIQAQDSVGNVGNRGYTINVGTSSLTVNPASLPNATQNVAYNQTVSATGGTAPYTYSLTSGALPTGLTLNPGTGQISGTPTGSGPSTFTVQGRDSAGNVGSRSYTVNVGTNSLVINPATLPAAILGRPYQQTLSTTGGTPIYVYSLLSGALPPGLTLNGATGLLSGTPSAAGMFAFVIQSRDPNGNVGSRSYSIGNRADPAVDAEVQGLIASQVATAKRFATAQNDNVARHLEQLHSAELCLTDFNLRLSSVNEAPTQPGLPSDDAFNRSTRGDRAMDARDPRSDRTDCNDRSLSAWAAGSGQFGSSTAPGNRFTTAGMTAGLDWRVAPSLTVGAAVGYGADHSVIGLRGTLSDTTSVSGSLYASYQPLPYWFVDAVVGVGSLAYENKRFVTGDGSIATGTRSGSYTSASLSIGRDFRSDYLKITPYMRGDIVAVQLGDSAEHGRSAELLSYKAMGFNSMSVTGGLRGSYDIVTGAGLFTPNARVEYRAAFDGDFKQSVYYTDIGPASSSVVAQAAQRGGSINTAVGLQWRGVNGLRSELEYGFAAGLNTTTSTVRASVKTDF